MRTLKHDLCMFSLYIIIIVITSVNIEIGDPFVKMTEIESNYS